MCLMTLLFVLLSGKLGLIYYRDYETFMRASTGDINTVIRLYFKNQTALGQNTEPRRSRQHINLLCRRHSTETTFDR